MAMKRHRDAMKRVRQNPRRRLRNREVISRIKTLRKRVISAATPEERSLALREVTSAIGKAAQKSIFHPNKAARWVSRIAKQINRIANV